MADLITTINNSDSLNVDLGMDDEKTYNYLLSLASKRSGISVEVIQDGMRRIAFHESKGDPKKIQVSNLYDKDGKIIGTKPGPGAGKYQYERGEHFGGSNAGRRAINRLYNYMGGDITTGRAPDYYPSWLEGLFPKTSEGYLLTQGSVDASQLTDMQQDMIFLADKLGQPGLDWEGFGSGEWAAKYHYGGPQQEEYADKYNKDMIYYK
tara:strand:+ start:13098 stop:13721 length:624 start_codon:yes stop_codon:yes gene_type:complete